jgi:two-component system, NtrC family, sensor kinase
MDNSDRVLCDADIMQLLAGLAHEINTPLAAIKSSNDVVNEAFRKLAQGIEAGPAGTALQVDSQEMLDVVEDSVRTTRLACERLINIVNNVRSFARLEDAKCKKTDIHNSIDSTLALLAHMFKGRIEVVKDYDGVRLIDCYPGQLHQILLNVILNATQAIEGEGTIRIKTWEAGDSVHIAISDNGRGISPDLASQIFDLGFTTKQMAVGTGLGLSIVSKAVRNHHGCIEVESEVGKGSTFTITLPVTHDVERETHG